MSVPDWFRVGVQFVHPVRVTSPQVLPGTSQETTGREDHWCGRRCSPHRRGLSPVVAGHREERRRADDRDRKGRHGPTLVLVPSGQTEKAKSDVVPKRGFTTLCRQGDDLSRRGVSLHTRARGFCVLLRVSLEQGRSGSAHGQLSSSPSISPRVGASLDLCRRSRVTHLLCVAAHLLRFEALGRHTRGAGFRRVPGVRGPGRPGPVARCATERWTPADRPLRSFRVIRHRVPRAVLRVRCGFSIFSRRGPSARPPSGAESFAEEVREAAQETPTPPQERRGGPEGGPAARGSPSRRRYLCRKNSSLFRETDAASRRRRPAAEGSRVPPAPPGSSAPLPPLPPLRSPARRRKGKRRPVSRDRTGKDPRGDGTLRLGRHPGSGRVPAEGVGGVRPRTSAVSPQATKGKSDTTGLRAAPEREKS